MALVAPVENGKIVETASQTSVSKAAKSSSGMDKEAFLQLLVAQMKYQDPLEPTSNTEYIAQYAQFSQVEQMQNMSNSMDLQRASSLVGKEVYIKTTTSSGDTKLVQGKVDYVSYENNKAYLYINDSIDDLDSVVDTDYLNAYNKAYNFTVKLNKLPNVNGIDSSDGKTIDDLEKEYNDMTDYEKSFLAKDTVNSLNKYIERLKEIRKAAEEAEEKKDTESKDESEETDSTESV